MKTTRLVIGIITIVFFFIITFQSCAVGLGNALQDNGETSGTAGFGVALFWLVGGIVGISARKSKGGSITAGVFYLIAGIIGSANTSSFGDLQVYSVMSFIFAAVFIIGALLQKKKIDTDKA